VVTASSPAQPGETVQVFMTGLGNVTPEVADGVGAPSNPLSNTVEAVTVFLDDGVDFVPTVVSFAGLAPGFAGLYQVNFAVPDGGLINGNVRIAINTTEALNEMATISLSGFSGRAVQNVSNHNAAGLQRRAALTVAGRGGHAKPLRRALP
jgi:uncharacterized protein (TIGR03437 family)